MKKSTDDVNSRYTQGGLTDVFPQRLGWWDRYILEKDPTTDYEYIIPDKYHQRPHNLAYDVYGRADYFFIILQYNNIIDVFEEFTAGKKLIMPTQQRLSGFLNKQRGGNII